VSTSSDVCGFIVSPFCNSLSEVLLAMSMFERMKNLPQIVLRPVPVGLFQPVLRRLIENVIRNHPDIFDRLESSHHKSILINPTNFPFVFLLRPNPQDPFLRAYRRRNAPEYDARISGSFLTLLRMVDGQLDGDALFFTRDLSIEGDTEIIVSLRNALDDMEGSIADDIAKFFGRAGHVALNALRNLDGKKVHL
jgi:predicted lipid carrier protein YhbT